LTAIADAVRVCLLHKLPLALRGRPGVGKTSLVESTARTLGLSCEVVVGSLREPTDLAGLPVISADGSVILAPPAWALRAKAITSGAVVLLDELTTASPSVQSAMLRIVREGVVGEERLPDHVRVVAAYNDADDCGGYELELPMRSRLLHIEVTADVDTFITGVTEGWPDQVVDCTTMDSSTHPPSRDKWCRLVAAFVKTRPSMLECPPAIGTWGGYPTPRTWEMLIDAAAAADAEGVSDETRSILIGGCIGTGAALEFMTFVDQVDLPDPVMLLANPELAAVVFEQSRPDRVMVVLMEVAYTVQSSSDPTQWTNIWKIGAQAVSAGFGDLVAWTFRSVARYRPMNATVPEEFATVRKFLEIA